MKRRSAAGPSAGASPAKSRLCSTATAAHSLPFETRWVAAPMVGQSDLAFRLQVRRHGAELVYTQMIDPARYVAEPAYRDCMLEPHRDDRPLVAQLSGNDPATVAAAAAMLEREGLADAVDFNLGCPQPAAADGMYGAYLLDREHWPRVASVVQALRQAVQLPVLCKIRLLPTLAETLEFCRLLQQAGCQMLVVHGRFRCSTHQRQRRRGAANLAWVQAIKEALDIPVLSNGNVRTGADLPANLESTGADGLMVAEALLENPALFAQRKRAGFGSGGSAAVGRVAAEYLALAEIW